jgi:hypothetical protein
MPIQVQTKLGGQIYGFNESRLQKIMEANTLQEAQRMGFLDKLTDTVFHGSAKQTAIRELFNSVVDPRSDQSAPTDMVSRFLRLRDLAHEDHRDQFTIRNSRPDADHHWSYALNVGDTAIYRSPPDLTDVPQTSFNDFMDEVLSYVVVNRTINLARRQQSLGDAYLLEVGGSANVDEVTTLKKLFNSDVQDTMGIPRHPSFDALEKLVDLQKKRPEQAEQAIEALEQVSLGNGRTNLLQVLLGSQIPFSAVRGGMAGLLNEVAQGSKDALDLTVQAKRFGETLLARTPPNSSTEAVGARVVDEFREWSKGLSNDELTHLYRAYIDKFEFTSLQQAYGNTLFTAGSKAPLPGEGEKEFMEEFNQRLRPFKLGLDAIGQLFDAVKVAMRERGLDAEVLGDDDEKRIGDARGEPDARVLTLLDRCAVDNEPMEQVLLDLRGNG